VPSIAVHEAGGSGDHYAEDTLMASGGQLRSLKAWVLVPDGFLGWLGTGSTMQGCSGGSVGARQSLLNRARK